MENDVNSKTCRNNWKSRAGLRCLSTVRYHCYTDIRYPMNQEIWKIFLLPRGDYADRICGDGGAAINFDVVDSTMHTIQSDEFNLCVCKRLFSKLPSVF